MSGILCRVDGQVATVTLHRPDKLNAFRPQELDELLAVILDLSTRSDLRVVVLTGAGRAFCAGGDVSVLQTGGMAGGRSDEEAFEAVRTGPQRLIEELRSLPQMTVAAINGPCAGGGLALACATDLRIASDAATFATGFTRVGQPGDMGLSWLLVRLVGTGGAMRLMSLAERIDCARALAMGLVDEVVPAGDLPGRVTEITADLAARAPVGMQAMKRGIHDAETMELHRYLDVETERYVANARTEDSTEAANAFIEKRPPQFTGR